MGSLSTNRSVSGMMEEFSPPGSRVMRFDRFTLAMSRRDLLWRLGGGLGGIALTHLLGHDGLLAGAPAPRKDLNGGLHHRAKVKRVIQLFMNGGASQCDT